MSERMLLFSIKDKTLGRISVPTATAYDVLGKLEASGMVESKEQESTSSVRKRTYQKKVYCLTDIGRQYAIEARDTLRLLIAEGT